jgi:MFS family permease
MRVAFIAPAAGGFAAMALVGFFAALGPTTMEHALHISNRALSGIIVAELFVVAALAIFATANTQPRTTMMIGHIAIPAGVALLVCAQRLGSLWLMVASAAVCGFSSALGYRGGLAVVNTLTPPERRAETVSTYFVCCFLGNALPIVGVTALTQMQDAERASETFAIVLSAIGLCALGAARTVRTRAE